MKEEHKKNWGKIKEESDQEEHLEVEESSGSTSLEHPDYAKLEEQLTQAEQTAHENWEKAVRAMAELDNVRRRAERDVANAHKYGMEKLISALLPVVDSLEQALQVEASQNMREGLELTMKLFLDALAKQDVEQINPEGELFDPQQHEAMSIQEVEGVAPNTVLVVFQKGYKSNDRVIRPARVIVSKAKA